MYFDDHVRRDEAIKCVEFMKLNNIHTVMKSSYYENVLKTSSEGSSREHIEVPKDGAPSSATLSKVCFMTV